MSSGESAVTNAAMTLFGRSAGLSLPGRKFMSCLARYSGIWLASFGFAGPMLLPSGPWHAAQTSLAIFCPLARSAFGRGSPASAAPAAKVAAANAEQSFMDSPLSTSGWCPACCPATGRPKKAAILPALPRRCDAMSLFQNATYVASAHRLQDLPPPGGPEIAFAGRSNAGKSSAINALANRTRLAFVSKTPGRTQTINLFRLTGGGILADLPGYGYAKVPEALRRHWEATLSAYLQTRTSLRGLALVMDARHPLTERDELMLAWFRPTGRPIHVLLTKADKLTRGAAAATLARVREHLRTLRGNYTAQLFSSLDRTGLEEAEAVFAGWLEAGSGDGNKKAPGQRGKPGAKCLSD